MTDIPFIDDDELQRRVMPLMPLAERYFAGAKIDDEELTDAINKVDIPATYRTRLPGWEYDITVGLAGTVMHLPGGDLLIHVETDDFVQDGTD